MTSLGKSRSENCTALFAIVTIFNIKGAQKGEIANFYFIFHPILMGY
jgi:hypothetical protein